MTLETLTITRRGAAAWVTMNLPAVHNAFDQTLIDELTRSYQDLDTDDTVRAIVLTGAGKSFSAGANLAWMQRQGAAGEAENLADARKLAQLFHTIAHCSTPTVARVHGAALGGGMGLACASDICVASTQASFATSEVLFGIIPSAISPYVLRAIGERQATRYFQSAERIDADRALAIGLVHELVAPDQLDAAVDAVVAALLRGGPKAQAASTALIRAVAHHPVDAKVIEDTALRIAQLRASPEAREGLAAFLDKRAPRWTQP